jgi:hypothetical protein
MKFDTGAFLVKFVDEFRFWLNPRVTGILSEDLEKSAVKTPTLEENH